MKNKVRLVYVLVAVAAVLGVTMVAGASANHVPVSGVEMPLCLPPTPHPDCTDGEWTFPGDNQHVRNWVLVYQVDGSDDRIIGLNRLVANANWDADGFGPGWGTFHHQPAAHPDGYWDGTWSAQMTADGYVSRIVGRGYGQLEGLKYQAIEVNGYIEGEILELPSN